MKRFLKKSGFWLGVIILAQTIIYIIAGAGKAYFHMDEIYSYGLANYPRVQIYETEDFYGTWHGAEYYDEYLTAGEGDSWGAVYENQKNDVHPPLFYGLLRAGMEAMGRFSKWTGILLNIVIAAGATGVMWLVARRLARDEKKALVLTAMAALSMAAVSTVIYIRMYELLTLWILLTTWLHLKLMEVKTGRERKRLLVGIFVIELLGALTQYYYWFYLAAMFGVMAARWAKAKKWKELRGYAMVVVGAGLASLAVWPYALGHMFFSNRGEGVIERFAHPGEMIENLWKYVGVVDRYAMHYLLVVTIAGMLVLGAKALGRGARMKLDERRREIYGTVMIPVVFYLAVVTAVSPFVELRYVAPVCGLLIILVAVAAEEMIRLTWKPIVAKKVLAGMLGAFVLMPLVAGVKPDTLYRERAGIMEWAKVKSGAPVLYMTKGERDWIFLNDLPMFREFKESYIAKGVTKEKEIRQILRGKDLSKGLVVVVNDDYDDEQMMDLVKRAMGMPEEEYAGRLVTSEVYYLR